MKFVKTVIAASLVLAAASAIAQQAATPSAAGAQAAAQQEWKYKTKQLSTSEVDALLLQPNKVLVLDVRRPDELPGKGSFPVYLKYIPKDRQIVTVSNRAHRAGAAGDLLSLRGYKVAGAIGTQDYEEQGGKFVEHITPPAPPAAPAAPAVAQVK